LGWTEPAAAEPMAQGSRRDVDVAGLEKAMSEGAIVIDVRTDEEWAEGHVPGVLHLPMNEVSASHPKLASLAPDQEVYVICRSGGRSSRVSDALASEGMKTVNVEGGTLAWSASGRPLDVPGADADDAPAADGGAE